MHDVQDQVEQLLALVFENYKSLDETTSTGVSQNLALIVEAASPALAPAVKLYTLLHDVLSSETQRSLRHYFQVCLAFRLIIFSQHAFSFGFCIGVVDQEYFRDYCISYAFLRLFSQHAVLFSFYRLLTKNV